MSLWNSCVGGADYKSLVLMVVLFQGCIRWWNCTRIQTLPRWHWDHCTYISWHGNQDKQYPLCLQYGRHWTPRSRREREMLALLFHNLGVRLKSAWVMLSWDTDYFVFSWFFFYVRVASYPGCLVGMLKNVSTRLVPRRGTRLVETLKLCYFLMAWQQG